MHMRDKYDLEIYLEPGEAVALDAGYLETTVLDIVENNGIKILILDTSAACHMPDVLEMPYRPPLIGAGEAGESRIRSAWADQPVFRGTASGIIRLMHR